MLCPSVSRVARVSTNSNTYRYRTIPYKLPYLFICLTPLKFSGYYDPLVELDVYRLTDKKDYVGLPVIDSRKV